MSAPGQDILFEEEQSFRQPWVWALMAATVLLLVVVSGIVLSGASVKPGSNRLPAVIGLASGGVVVIAVALLMYFMKLSVRMDGKVLHIRFVPLVKRDIPLEEIARWEARTYRPLVEYGGWGVRYGLRGVAYNVSGNRGVQLELANGKRLLIGSQRAEELAAAISLAKQHGG